MKRMESATGAVGAGGAVTAPTPEVLGPFLTTHFIGVLSYAEIIQIIGAIWVVFLAIKALRKGYLKIKSWWKDTK